jgi:putative FmdB family regulatory protein
MPVYEYQCQACQREFEYQQRMSDPDKTVCEACGGALERLISRTAFQLKGSGWYKDLYSSTKPAAETKTAEAKTESAAPSSGDGGSSTGTSTGTGTGTGTGTTTTKDSGSKAAASSS